MNAAPLTIGIVGGISPESTGTYYKRIVERHRAERGDHAYPRIVIASVTFATYLEWQHAGKWERIGRALEQELQSLKSAGADFALIGANTMHKALPSIRLALPVLSVLDAVGAHAKAKGIASLGLTGTRFTMSDGFYARGLEERGVAAVVPDAAEQEAIQRIIFEELVRGRVERESVARFAEIARGLVRRGAQAVLLACTELGMLTRGGGVDAPTVDTLELHADAAWEVAMGLKPLQ